MFWKVLAVYAANKMIQTMMVSRGCSASIYVKIKPRPKWASLTSWKNLNSTGLCVNGAIGESKVKQMQRATKTSLVLLGALAASFFTARDVQKPIFVRANTKTLIYIRIELSPCSLLIFSCHSSTAEHMDTRRKTTICTELFQKWNDPLHLQQVLFFPDALSAVDSCDLIVFY